MKIFIQIIKITLVLIFIFSFTIIKENTKTEINAHTIEGLWVGTYLSNQESRNPPQEMNLTIKKDGTIICYTKGDGEKYISIGNWKLTKNNFSAIIKNVWKEYGSIDVEQKLKATYIKKTGKLSNGKWENISSNEDSGTFSLKEVL